MNLQIVQIFRQFDLFTNKINNCLSGKQMQQSEFLVDKCLANLDSLDKNGYERFISNFLRWLINCPYNQNQMFFKKYYLLVKVSSNLRISTQQKYKFLISGIVQISQKVYRDDFNQLIKNKNVKNYAQISTKIDNLSSKGGFQLKGFINLLKKTQQKNKDMRHLDFLILIKDCYFLVIQQFLYSSKSINEKLSFRFYLLKTIFDRNASKFQKQAKQIYRQTYDEYCNTDDPSHLAVRLTFLLMILNSKNDLNFSLFRNDVDLKQIKIKTAQQNLFYTPTVIIISVFLKNFQNRSLIESQIKPQIQEQDYLSFIIKLASKRFCLQSIQSIKEPSFQNLLASMYVSLAFQAKSSIKNQFYEFLKLTIRPIIALPQFFDQDFKTMYQYLDKYLFQKINSSYFLSTKSKIYLFSLYWLFVNSNILDYQTSLTFQKLLYSKINIFITEKDQTTESRQFLYDLYMMSNFKLSLQQFMKTFYDSKNNCQQTTDLFAIIGSKINNNQNQMKQEVSHQQLFDSKIHLLKQGKITIESLYNLLGSFFYKNESKICKKSQKFLSLSIIMFQKLNIVPKLNRPSDISKTFMTQFRQDKTALFKHIVKKLYSLDHFLKENSYFMKDIDQNLLSNDKIIVYALKKYTAINYNRLNDVIIKRWIKDRQYLKIWTQMFCSKHVKTINDLFLKSDLIDQELQCFFNIEPSLIRVFVEYLATKDKFKFKLALWQVKKAERIDLLDFSLVKILI